MAHILIIDDERMIRMSVAQALTRLGHTVIEAVDGADGLQKFEAAPTDLVITDILMPNKEGMATIEELLALRPDLKIIAISGGGRLKNVTFLDVAVQLGAKAVLKKPFTVAALVAAVESCLGEATSPHAA